MDNTKENCKEISFYTREKFSIADLLKLGALDTEINKKVFSVEVDYSECYYESDAPRVKIEYVG